MDNEFFNNAAVVAGKSDSRIGEVLLFGSYARREETGGSDIDFALVTKGDISIGQGATTQTELAAANALEKAGYRTRGRSGAFDVLSVSEETLTGQLSKEDPVQGVVRDGIILWKRHGE